MKPILFIISLSVTLACQGQSPVLLSTERADSLLKAMPAIQLLDVRTAGEYANGHLNHALNVDVRDEAFANKVKQLDPSKPILVYCLAGSRSAKAADLLASAGFRQVYDMQGGFAKWTANKKPVEGPSDAPKGALTAEEFQKITASSKPVLIDFFAPWCAPCQKMLPTVHKLKAEMADKITIVTIDYDKNRQLAQQLGVDEIPTFLIFKEGKPKWRGIGYMDEAMFKKTIEEYK